VVYVYPSRTAAENGERAGGSGFSIAVDINKYGLKMHYVVTNHHVAVNARAVRFRTQGGTLIIDTHPDDWIPHPDGDDVAILPIGMPGIGFPYRTLGDSIFLTPMLMNQLNVGPGDDTFMVGRFISHDGRIANNPLVRFGNIAMLPGEPIYQKERAYWQESFLVESRSLSGFSGSPVFLYIPPFSYRFRSGDFTPEAISPETSLYLLGIDWGNMRLEDEANMTNTGIMAVVPVWKLAELLESDDVQTLHRDAVAEHEELAQGFLDAHETDD